jgi:NAD(P)-dependent dehydrogenase (short-subunit alcohol dehydrogenase family)
MGLVDGKIAMVTGGASGMGREGVRVFAREGAAHVYIVDLNEKGGSETVEIAKEQGAPATFLNVDLTDEDAVAATVKRIVDEQGRLDCAWNNAGINDTSKAFHEFTKVEWDRMIAVNLSSVFWCMKHEITQMLRQGGGAICNTSSGAGLIAAPGLPHYTAAKHGVLGLTKAAAGELNNSGIRVNAICPGMVDTPMIQGWFETNPDLAKVVLQGMPGQRLMEPIEIAESAVWLCSDAARGVSGLSMVVDAGGVNR